MNWNALQRLRARFLQFDDREQGAEANHSNYWRSLSDLVSYDGTFGERIGWKWDTVLAELKTRGWAPPEEATLLDWGCGTGVAGRRVAAAWPAAFQRLILSDRSGPARHFSQERAQAELPGLEARTAAPGEGAEVLVLSHVLNELNREALEKLLELASSAQVILWVEPGTYPVSRRLIAIRERLRLLFRTVSPCTHQETCGLLTADNERHWCHHFARVPSFVHTDPGWGKFAKTLEVDLASVPFSYLILDRRPAAAAPDPAEARVIGVPRYYKGYAKVLSCQADGVAERILQKRDAPDLLKAMKKAPGSLYRWDRDGEKIHDGELIF